MATPTTPRKQENSHEPTLLLAFELGLKTWKRGFVQQFPIEGKKVEAGPS